MKTKLKLLLAALALQVFCLGFAAIAATQPICPVYNLEFDIDKITPQAIEAYHGEKIEINVNLKRNGLFLKFAQPALCTFYWQEVGMGDQYWSNDFYPECDGNTTYTVEFLPSMDTGAKVYNCFIGEPAANYRAAFQIRMRPSPGAEPAVLPLPVKTLDFDKVKVENAPYYTKDEADAATEAAIVSKVTKEYVEGLGITGGGTVEVDTTLTQSGMAADAKKVGDNFSGLAEDFHQINSISGLAYSKAEKAESTVESLSVWAQSHMGEFNAVNAKANVAFTTANEAKATAESAIGTANQASEDVSQVEERVAKVEDLKSGVELLSIKTDEAIIAVNSIALYMNGNTNAWFAGTNYVTNAEQLAKRRRFKFDEDLMDAATVPCSLALWELRDGEKQVVWDQRDWTAWYWDFREEQLKAGWAKSLKELNKAIDSKAPAAWGSRTPSKGLVNPNPDTLWVDTKSVTLSPGMAWETVLETEGCAYWTIVADNVEIGGTSSGDDSGTLEIKDYEGKSVMKIFKTASKMVPLVKGDFETIDVNVDGYVGFMLRTNVQPIGEFCEIVNGVYVEDTSDDCPADVIYTPFGDDKYRVYFKAKDRYATSMFAKFKVEKQGETTIEFGAPQTINGGIIYNGVKIAPEVVPGMAVGTTVTWKVVE